MSVALINFDFINITVAVYRVFKLAGGKMLAGGRNDCHVMTVMPMNQSLSSLIIYNLFRGFNNFDDNKIFQVDVCC
jgi:hypothetical protein